MIKVRTHRKTQRPRRKRKRSVIEGSYLRFTDQKILVALFAANVSGRKAAGIVGCDKDTACAFFRKLREKVKAHLGDRVSTSTDEGAEGGATAPAVAPSSVEVDEMYLGSERARNRAGKVTQAQRRRDSLNPKKRGRGTAKFCIAGAIVRSTGEMFVRRIPNASAPQLYCFIADNFRAGATIYTDGWKGYGGLNDLGFDHHTVNHSKGEYVRIREDSGEKIHTNTMENGWRHLKQRMRPYFGGFKRNVDMFLAEAVFFFKRRLRDALEELRLLPVPSS